MTSANSQNSVTRLRFLSPAKEVTTPIVYMKYIVVGQQCRSLTDSVFDCCFVQVCDEFRNGILVTVLHNYVYEDKYIGARTTNM